MLVYVHVPFCKTRCNYCAFFSQTLESGVLPQASPMVRSYVDGLLLEIAHNADKYASQEVQSVFFGGGTPSILPPKILDVIINRISRNFKLSSKAEITLEANPESLRGRNVMGDYLAAGVNRLSIGLQSLDDTILKMLGRSHKAQDSLHAIYAAREAGFANVSVDLMWGLPGQSMRQWLQTLKDVVALGPDHISSYGLSLEPGTRLEKLCETGELQLPPERDQSIMFMEGAAYLEAQGFIHYEISNFSRMGYQSRHNLGYWEGASYLGLGPSATSTIGDRRWTNPANFESWLARANGGIAEANVEVLSPKTRALELVMLRLRTARGLRLKAYKDMTGRDFLRDHQRFVQALHDNGLARIRNGYLSLTRSGMLVSNSIISNLFERMETTLDENFSEFKMPAPEPEPVFERGAALPAAFPRV